MSEFITCTLSNGRAILFRKTSILSVDKNPETLIIRLRTTEGRNNDLVYSSIEKQDGDFSQIKAELES